MQNQTEEDKKRDKWRIKKWKDRPLHHLRTTKRRRRRRKRLIRKAVDGFLKEEIKRENGKKTKLHTKATGALKVRGDRASTSSSTTRSSTSHPLPPFHQRHFHHQTNQRLISRHAKRK
jgi:hypothetical protein